MESRDDPRGNIVDPDAYSGSVVGVYWEEPWRAIWIGLLEVLKNNRGFIKGFGCPDTPVFYQAR